MTSIAYLSALGMMGRRHLKGLVRAGFDVIASDPNPAAFDAARSELAAAGLPSERLLPAGEQRPHFDVAVFAETTPDRLGNFQQFLTDASAGKILLEKPLSANPDEFAAFVATARSHGVLAQTQVNFIRRTWPHLQALQDLCSREERFSMTVNGGAIGLGCMGIHYLDTFLFLAGDDLPQVIWAELSDIQVASGRGAQFKDYGGEFVLRGKRASLFASLEAGSSANVVITVRGAHFLAQVDYTDMQWKLAVRKLDSTMPNYRYGADYQVVEDGRVELPAMDLVTEQWATGQRQLPTLALAQGPHVLLDQILRAGGAHPPYSFT